MADAPSYNDIFDTGRNEAIRLPTRFAPEIVDTDGSDVNVIISVGAAMADEVAAFLVQAFAEVFLSSAAKIGGEALDRYAYDKYQLIRLSTQAAVVPLSFSRTDTSQPLTIPAETECSTADGFIFSTVTDLVFLTGVAGPLIVTANATVAGTGGNSEKNAIDTILSALTDQTTIVTNTEVAAGGQPEEADTAFAARIRDFFVNARRGTAQAIFNGCVTTPGVAEANIIEVLDPNGAPGFRVEAIISDQNGQANSALVANVTLNLQAFRGLGVPVRVIGGAPAFVTIIIEGITFRSTANTNILIEEMRALIVSAVNELAPGTTLEVATIIRAMKFSPLVNVPGTALISPLGDLVALSNEVIRTSPSRVSINGVSGGLV